MRLLKITFLVIIMSSWFKLFSGAFALLPGSFLALEGWHCKLFCGRTEIGGNCFFAEQGGTVV